MIRKARQQHRPADGGQPTLKWLGNQCVPPRKPQQISKFESGGAVPADIGLLAEIYRVLHQGNEPDEDAARDFLPWIATWLEATRIGVPTPAVAQLLDESLRLLSAPAHARRSRKRDRPLTTLMDFPGDDPLTIIMSDRRERPVTSAAECLIYSGSITDAMFLPSMRDGLERATIRSDKLLVRMPTEYLEEQVPELSERNLLVIGSPAGNWGARIMNKSAIFPFRIESDVVRQSDLMIEDGRMQDEEFASEFWTRAEHSNGGRIALDPAELSGLSEEERQRRVGAADLANQVLGNSTVKAVMNKFRAQGIHDPADEEHHATFVTAANDFGVVTLARNPFSTSGRHRAVICAGIHGPGTAILLRELFENPQIFRHRPLGAVLEVRLRTDLAWSERFERAKVKPQTEEYTPDSVLENMERALAADHDDRKPVYRDWEPAALREAAQLVRDTIADSAAERSG